MVGHAGRDALRQREDATEFRRALPVEGQRDVDGRVLHLEGLAVRDDRLAQRLRVDLVAEFIQRLQYLQIPPRQEHAGIGDVARVAGKLDGVFRGAERGGADALARRQQRPREASRRDLAGDGRTKAFAEIAEVALLAGVDIFGDAAGKHHAAEIAEIEDGIGEIEVFHVMRHGAFGQRADKRFRHAIGDLVEVGRGHGVAQLPVEAGAPRVVPPGGIEAHEPEILVDDHQASANVDRGCRFALTALDKPELGGAAANVDVEDALAEIERGLRRARAIGRQHRFHVVASGGANEIAPLFRKHFRDALRVLAPQRLARQDHRAGIDVARLDPGAVIGVLHDFLERLVVDAGFAGIGRQRHGRQKERVAGDDVIAAGQILGEAAQMDFRENDLRARGTDVDADAGQGDIVLNPEGIFLQRAIVVELVVVVIGVAIVLVGPFLAHRMLVHGMDGWLLGFFVSHVPSELPALIE